MITPADSAPTAPEQMQASTWDIQAPYAAGAPQSIVGSATDDLSNSVAGAVAAAEARSHSHQTDTYGLGSSIGDQMTLPPQDFSVANAHQIGYTGDGNE